MDHHQKQKDAHVMPISDIYLSTQHLAVGYADHKVENRLFEDLNLSVQSGKMICFMGPNGAGKSSLLRTLAGLQKPLSGQVHLRLHQAKENTANQIAVVLTERLTALNLTVADIVTFGRYPYLGWNIHLSERDKAIVNVAVERVHLQPLLDKKLYELSDGQLQMAMIARALAQDTPIILLDEPTAHLDLNNRVEIMNLLRDLAHESQKAILLTTHELDLALQTADEIWLTGKTRNILKGFPEDLVLNGAFDEIFEFKGFDLKTGKVLHHPYRNVNIQLLGEGAPFLWTKNALERNGFNITTDSEEITIAVSHDFPHLQWIVKKNNLVDKADSIETLMNYL